MDKEYLGLTVDNLQVGQPNVGIYAPTAETLKHFEHLKSIPLKSIKCKHGNYFIRIGDEKK